MSDYSPPCVNCFKPNNNSCQLCDECSKLPCKHGNSHESCDQCDYEGDIAYDASKGN